MVFRQLKQEQYDRFTQQLIKKGRQEPLEESFSVTMRVDDKEYVLKLQPENNCKIFVLQALEVERDEFGHLHTLITSAWLSSLLEILIR